MEDYTIIITAKHLAGDKRLDSDCPGFRALKDALPNEVYLNIPTEPVNCRNWGLTSNRTRWDTGHHVWESYKKDLNGVLDLFNMMGAEIGDEVIFKKRFNLI